jgi:putative two-component system response regulator
MNNPIHILIIDESPHTLETLSTYLPAGEYCFHLTPNPADGLATALRIQPDVILLDILSSGPFGFVTCRHLRENEKLSQVPILLLCPEENRGLRRQGLIAGATDCLNKPLEKVEVIMRLTWLRRLCQQRELEQEQAVMAALIDEMEDTYDHTIEIWVDALGLHKPDSPGHLRRVCTDLLKLGRLAGLRGSALKQARRGALLHDFGSLKITKNAQPGQDDEMALATDGAWGPSASLAQVLFSQVDFLRPALDIPTCLHEKWDGSGYPRGLKGEQIPLAARLFAVIEAWDQACSITQDPSTVIESIQARSGRDFDPRVIKLFSDNIVVFQRNP